MTSSWLMTRPIAVGIIIQVTYLRIVVMPVRSSEWTRVKRLRLLGELGRVRLAADLGRA